MIKSAVIMVVLLTGCSLQSLVQGQERRERRGGADKVPAIGSPIPDIDVFDAQGRSFALREKLKGKHAVLVFGCLT